MKRSRVNLVASTVLLLSFAGAALTLRAIDHQRRPERFQEVLYIRSPRALKAISLGYTGLLADLYWTRAVQYFGYQHLTNSDDLHLLADQLSDPLRSGRADRQLGAAQSR